MHVYIIISSSNRNSNSGGGGGRRRRRRRSGGGGGTSSSRISISNSIRIGSASSSGWPLSSSEGSRVVARPWMMTVYRWPAFILARIRTCSS